MEDLEYLSRVLDKASFAWNNLLGRISTNPLTMPKQPAFLAYNSVTDANVTGNNTLATVDFDTEVFDQGNNFSADTFTAPVTGRYRFSAAVRMAELTNATSILLLLITSNRSIQLAYVETGTIGGGGIGTFSGGILTDMDAGDTAYVQIRVNGIGADTADVVGSSSPVTYFSGELVC